MTTGNGDNTDYILKIICGKHAMKHKSRPKSDTPFICKSKQN